MAIKRWRWLEIGDEDISKYNIASFRTRRAKEILAEMIKSVNETGRWIERTVINRKAVK